jgi:hypothetical protein
MPDVTIYQQSNFQGLSQALAPGRYNDALGEFTIGNDVISSLQVPQGLVARLYEHSHFQGRFIDIANDTPAINLFWNDRISSIIIYSANEQPPAINEVVIFEHSGYSGRAQILQPGKYDLPFIELGDNAVSSVLVPYGMLLTLYEHPDFQGAKMDIRNDIPALPLDFNDKASSLIVTEAPVGLWKISNSGAAVIGESTEYNGVRGISHAGGQSASAAAVTGVNDNTGPGVFGESNNGIAVVGESKSWIGMFGKSESTGHGVGVLGEALGAGVKGVSKTWIGVVGVGEATQGGGGVYGESNGGSGVTGISKVWMGVYGETVGSAAAGVWGEHKGAGNGVVGKTQSTTGGAGVWGESHGPGVIGVSQTWVGVYGETRNPAAHGAGVWGEHKGDGTGVFGVSNTGIGVMGKGGRLAGYFEGDVEVTGDIRLANADCAEDFDIADAQQIEPGTVMVLGEEGKLEQSQRAYDKRVAGVISGAGTYKPGIVLDKQSQGNRKPVALLGKVFCKVDASYGPIEIGDLLTTSPSPGHAMKVNDPLKAFGSVIGKALRPLTEGQSLIPILIALQ